MATKSNLRFQRFTFFVTNIPKNLLSNEEAATLYKFRWQIELVFKSFKSNFQVDLIKGQSKHRVECFILSKLIAIMVTSNLFAHVSQHTTSLYSRELSFHKFTQWILVHKYLSVLFHPNRLSYDVLQMSSMDILSLCKQKRSRLTSRELLEEEAILSDLYPQTTELQQLKLIA